jgi:DNA repair exonuclease SbcCD ATPase subunit
MRILSVEISNILSIESALLSFDTSGLVLIEGWNYDTGRANGAGKTAIANSIAFGIYDKLPRKITASEILRRGTRSGFVKCSIKCGEDIWTVMRSRPKGAQFWKNGILQEITQIEFESKIRLNYEQFLLTIYVPQANSGQLNRFLTCPDSDKKRFLLQLLNLENFTECKKIIDDKMKILSLKIDKEQVKLNAAISKIEAYQESLLTSEAISLIQATADSLSNLEKDIKNEIATLTLTAKPDFSKFSKIEDDIRSKIDEVMHAKMRRSSLHDKYRELYASVHEFDKERSCTECGSSLFSEDRKALHDIQQEKIKLKLVEIKLNIDKNDDIIAKENSYNSLYLKLCDKKEKESIDFQSSTTRVSELKLKVKMNQIQRENCIAKLTSNNELLNKIELLSKIIELTTIDTFSLKKELELYKTLSMIYSPTGAQAYVLDSIVDSFNEIVPKYLDLLSPNITYILNSYKETAKGDTVAKFSETLTKGGKEISVGSLSGGEQKGLSICVDFALLDVLETQFGMSLNPVILDEPFDALDVTGREIVIELLEQLASNRQIFVIDHVSEAKTLFSKIVRIELRNDISHIL